MNQYDFYTNFFKYRSNKEDLRHSSAYGDYYHKIDNYYGPGKSRYFDTKDEYDAYLREQQKIYDKAVEEQNQNKLNKFTSGRDAAIRNSNNNYAAINTRNERIAKEGTAGADRAKKEKENAEKRAKTPTEYTRRKFLEANLSGREAAINKSAEKTKEAMAEQKRMKNPVYAAMKNIQKRINRLENLQNQQNSRQAAINNSEKISDEEWKKRLEADKQYQQIAKMPGGKVIADSMVRKKTTLNNTPVEEVVVEEVETNEPTETKQTSIKDTYNTVKDLTSEYVAKSNADKQVKLNELNDNFKEFRTILQKLKRGGNTLTRKQIEDFKKTNPLYQALNESFADGDSEYDLLDYIDVGGKQGDMRIDYAEKSLNELVSALEDTINNGTVKTASKEQPKPGRSAI